MALYRNLDTGPYKSKSKVVFLVSLTMIIDPSEDKFSSGKGRLRIAPAIAYKMYSAPGYTKRYIVISQKRLRFAPFQLENPSF